MQSWFLPVIESRKIELLISQKVMKLDNGRKQVTKMIKS